MDALRGIGLLWRTPRLWGFCLGPLLGAFLVYVVLGILSGVLLLPRLAQWLGTLPGGGWWTGLAGGALVLVWILLFPFLFALLGGVLFGMVFEPLSVEVERLLRPEATATHVKLTAGAAFGDTLSRLGINLMLGLIALLFSFVLGPIPGILVAGIIGLLDYTAPAFQRRGLTVRPQLARLFRPLDARTVSFGLLAGLLSLVPLFGVFLIPGLVAGGTILTLRREEEAERSSERS